MLKYSLRLLTIFLVCTCFMFSFVFPVQAANIETLLRALFH